MQNVLSGLGDVGSMTPLSVLVDECKAVELGSFSWTLTDGGEEPPAVLQDRNLPQPVGSLLHMWDTGMSEDADL